MMKEAVFRRAMMAQPRSSVTLKRRSGNVAPTTTVPSWLADGHRFWTAESMNLNWLLVFEVLI